MGSEKETLITYRIKIHDQDKFKILVVELIIHIDQHEQYTKKNIF